jgi:hypothetical protein
VNEPLHISVFKKFAFIFNDTSTKRYVTFKFLVTVNRDMVSSRPSKRQRPDDGGSYHETIPFLNDFHAVHAREGRLNHLIRTAPPERSLQHASDKAWMTATSWGGPPDDPELALDPTGDWYDEMVDGEVMEPTDVNPVVALPKKKRSKVSVSNSISPLTSLTH